MGNSYMGSYIPNGPITNQIFSLECLIGVICVSWDTLILATGTTKMEHQLKRELDFGIIIITLT